MPSFLSQLNWRNATKAFDPNVAVSDADLHKITEAVRFAPTSFGLQPFYVRVVKNTGLRAKMQAAGWGQVQFPTSTAVLVFVVTGDVNKRIDQLVAERRKAGGDDKALAGYEQMMRGFASQLSPEAAIVWAQKQAYIALGFGLAACAELGVDSCPIEGFSPDEFDKILGLPAGHRSTVVLAVGRAAKDFKPYPKMRFSESDIVRVDA